jgi:hypothetical protein
VSHRLRRSTQIDDNQQFQQLSPEANDVQQLASVFFQPTNASRAKNDHPTAQRLATRTNLPQIAITLQVLCLLF